jgi:Ohr subfamily peroxiredoxin
VGKAIYTTGAKVIGGRDEGQAENADGTLKLDIRIPKQVGGPGGGTNPEELFAIGYAACFNNALKTAGRRMKLDADDAEVVSEVSLVANDNRGFDLAAKLGVTLPSLDDDKALELVKVAHKVCPFSNATRGNIEVEITANGQPVAD